MDTPKSNRTILPASTTAPPPSSSPAPSPTTVQESPFFTFLNNLSPIKSVKAAEYEERFYVTDLPMSMSVFASPRMDQQKQTSFLQREESSTQQERTGLDVRFQKEAAQPANSLPWIEEYLVENPVDNPHIHQDNDATKFVNNSVCHNDITGKAGDSNSGNVKDVVTVSEELPSIPLNRLDNQKCMQFRTNEVNDHVHSDIFLNSFMGSQQLLFQAGYNHQPGIHKQLQFDTAMSRKVHDSFNLSLPATLTSVDSLVSLSVEPTANLATSSCISPTSGFSLNNIPRTLSIGSELSASEKLAGNLHAQKETQMSGLDQNLEEKSDVFSAGKNYVHRESDLEENQAIVIASYTLDQSAYNMYSSCAPAPPFQKPPTSQNSEMVEELNRSTPKRDGKKAKYINEGEGCKHCNCKKSKCLKLYCECFASGVYCVESCACENCYNKPEYDDIVLETRQKIESRNPLAFAPKVVEHSTRTPTNMKENLNWTTPSSARHKRGCNCKKSRCVKKYCECYQGRVGCSDGCRCEGCDNSFGRKTDLVYINEKRETNPSYEQFNSLETRNDFTWRVLSDISNLSPNLPPSGNVASSASLNISKVPKVYSHQESHLHSFPDYLHLQNSATSHSPKSYGHKGLAELNSAGFLYDSLQENDSPQELKNTCTPVLNQILSSPRIQSQELRSSSSQGPRSGRKLILQKLPSFPHLTPYSKSKDGMHKSDANPESSTGSQ